MNCERSMNHLVYIYLFLFFSCLQRFCSIFILASPCNLYRWMYNELSLHQNEGVALYDAEILRCHLATVSVIFPLACLCYKPFYPYDGAR